MKDIDDIEVLDILVDNKNKKESVSSMPKTGKKRKVKIKSFQILFCIISALFILVCCGFYGSRLIKYYKIYNPKADDGTVATFLANKITNTSEIVYENSGLYINSGIYSYKGKVTNNYIKYNNMLWRIVKINPDGTMQVILDDYINVMPWNKENTDFVKSDLSKYLNDVFLNGLNKNLLNKTSMCSDKIEDLDNITCESYDSSYVTTLDVTTYLNSVADKETFLSKDGEIFWLSNYSTKKVWHTNGSNISQSESTSFYEVRPVITLKQSIVYTSGDGTIENPYLTDKISSITVGSTIKLGSDKWIVYEIGENIKLMRDDVLPITKNFDNEKLVYDTNSTGSLAHYLNTDYLDSLSYKDLLVENKWYIGAYKNSYLDIKESTITSKVGLPNLMDLKFDGKVSNYFLSTSDNDKYIYVYGEVLKSSKPSIYKSVRPCIALKKDLKVTTGKGTTTEPFEVEA